MHLTRKTVTASFGPVVSSLAALIGTVPAQPLDCYTTLDCWLVHSTLDPVFMLCFDATNLHWLRLFSMMQSRRANLECNHYSPDCLQVEYNFEACWFCCDCCSSWPMSLMQCSATLVPCLQWVPCWLWGEFVGEISPFHWEIYCGVVYIALLAIGSLHIYPSKLILDVILCELCYHGCYPRVLFPFSAEDEHLCPKSGVCVPMLLLGQIPSCQSAQPG